jgi:hypothetical protein
MNVALERFATRALDVLIIWEVSTALVGMVLLEEVRFVKVGFSK